MNKSLEYKFSNTIHFVSIDPFTACLSIQLSVYDHMNGDRCYEDYCACGERE